MNRRAELWRIDAAVVGTSRCTVAREWGGGSLARLFPCPLRWFGGSRSQSCSRLAVLRGAPVDGAVHRIVRLAHEPFVSARERVFRPYRGARMLSGWLRSREPLGIVQTWVAIVVVRLSGPQARCGGRCEFRAWRVCLLFTKRPLAQPRHRADRSPAALRLLVPGRSWRTLGISVAAIAVSLI